MLIKYNRPNIHDAYEMKFTPGVNQVDDVKWEHATKVLKDAELLRFLDDKTMEIMEKSASKREVKGDALDAFEDAKALQMIKATFKVDLLEKWKYGEKRPAVSQAIDHQLAEIKADANKGKEKKE